MPERSAVVPEIRALLIGLLVVLGVLLWPTEASREMTTADGAATTVAAGANASETWPTAVERAALVEIPQSAPSEDRRADVLP